MKHNSVDGTRRSMGCNCCAKVKGSCYELIRKPFSVGFKPLFWREIFYGDR